MTEEKKSDPVGDTVLGVFVIIFLCFLVWVVGAWITGFDDSHWERIDVDGECWVHVVEVNNVWITPGSNSETRNTYCQKA